MASESDEQSGGVLAPNATVVTKIPSDPATVAPAIVWPERGREGYTLVRDGYSLERVDPERVGYAAHEFATLRSFAGYLNRNLGDVADEIDILVERDAVYAFVEPQREEPQILKAALRRHPCFDAWVKVAGTEMVQKEIFQIVRAWRGFIVEADNVSHALGQLHLVRNTSMTSHLDETGATRLRSSDNETDLSVRVPATVVLRTPIYDGVEDLETGEPITYDIEWLMTVDTDPPVTFCVEAPALELTLRQARVDAAGTLAKLLGEGWLVSVGDGSHKTRVAIYDVGQPSG